MIRRCVFVVTTSSKIRVNSIWVGTIVRRCRLVAAAAGLTLLFGGCTCRLAIPAGVCIQRTAEGPLPGQMPRLCLVNPVTPRDPKVLILFATGDGGWIGASKPLFLHLAQRGDAVAGFSATNYLKDVERQAGFITPKRLAEDLAAIVAATQREMDLPPATPTILVGMSRGAGFMVVAGEHKALQPRPAGAVALSLTRETDYVRNLRMTEKHAESTQDDGRVLTYARLRSAREVPLAVIQSTHDRYLPAAKARELFGPDAGNRRFREVEARNHGFGGGRDAMFRELDDALNWIESLPPPK